MQVWVFTKPTKPKKRRYHANLKIKPIDKIIKRQHNTSSRQRSNNKKLYSRRLNIKNGFLGVTDGIKLKSEIACEFEGRKCQQKNDSMEWKYGI